MRTGKSWFFWLGLFISAYGTFRVFTGTQYIPLSNGGYLENMSTGYVVLGIVFFLVGLYMMYSGRNKPGSPTETILF